ncbi:hypothetical protein JOD54_004442 [Actinokineospora baliensis]|uniref:hypothetical protein n=1 Tax=Actinokineospora baliensis TaxID=547056 RepID=UPI00195AF2CD|nr:hypothetical protein [Actinokineospora baliensis]MBM7774238.1 hypothetical protein [Actinokineospora baliensis]
MDHGVALTARVIDSVRANPTRSLFDYAPVPWVVGSPRPVPEDVLAGLAFPSGRPLPPSLRAWLAFDTGLLARYGWFTPDGDFAPRPLDRLVAEELSEPWAEDFAVLNDRFPECYLLPGGSDSRRLLAVGEPDSTGEYPVLALDLDDLPFLGLVYPGFDVYLAHTAGFLTVPGPGYTGLAQDPVYGRRMREHAAHRFDGEMYAQFPF